MQPKYGIFFSLPLLKGMEMDFWMENYYGSQWSQFPRGAYSFDSKKEAENHLEVIYDYTEEELLLLLDVKQLPS